MLLYNQPAVASLRTSSHESILTTEIYTHIDSATWQADILSHHPRG